MLIPGTHADKEVIKNIPNSKKIYLNNYLMQGKGYELRESRTAFQGNSTGDPLFTMPEHVPKSNTQVNVATGKHRE